MWSTTIPSAFLGAGFRARQTSARAHSPSPPPTPAREQGGADRGHAALLGSGKAAAPRALLSGPLHSSSLGEL